MASAHRNPLPLPTPYEEVLLRELAKVAKRCYERGWSHGTAGNFSLRGRDGLVWQSPSGLNKGELNPSLFLPIDLASARPVSPLPVRPSQEMAVHLGVYRAVPAAQARSVVHCHPPALVALSREGADLQFQGEEMQKHLGCKDHLEALRVPVVKNPSPAEMPAMADATAAHVNAKVPMVVLAAHGVYAWGQTPMEALSFIEAAEFLCQTQLSRR
jgi:methylthioribulose-1-phosphate dehydratase